jgi:WD40 repeat protein
LLEPFFNTYSPNLTAFNLSLLTTATYASASGGFFGPGIYSVAWSPDGAFLATGGTVPTTDGNEVRVYTFDGATLTLVATATNGADVFSVDWTSDGSYLAIGGFATQPGNPTSIRVYHFDKTPGSESLTQIATSTIGQAILSVDWSPDDAFLGAGGFPLSANFDSVFVYSFNKTNSTLSFVTTATFKQAPFSVSWSPSGIYLAAGGSSGSFDPSLIIYSFSGTALTIVATTTQ